VPHPQGVDARFADERDERKVFVMAKTTISQKAQRVVKFLVGLRHPRVASHLVGHGFTEADFREGFQLLTALVHIQLAPAPATEDPKLIKRLEAFEKRWFGIARAALGRHHPELARAFFANLGPLEGAQVAVSVATFVERLEALSKAGSPFGADAAEARSLLARRGLSDARLAEGRALLEEMSTLRVAPIREVPAAEQKAAEDALWRWYREWSQIARAAISDRRVLRSLGFLNAKRKAGPEDEETLLDSGAHALAPAQGTAAVATVTTTGHLLTAVRTSGAA
jgi:hypothetical protein